jgi:hypothetical protein
MRTKIWEVRVGQRRRGAILSVQSKVIDKRFVLSWFPPDVLTGWPAKAFFYQPKILLTHYAKTFFYQTKIRRINYNQNCKSNNSVEMSHPQNIQINPIICQCHNYIYPDSSIKFGDGGRSEETRPKIWEVGVGQRRRGAMLSTQKEAID